MTIGISLLFLVYVYDMLLSLFRHANNTFSGSLNYFFVPFKLLWSWQRRLSLYPNKSLYLLVSVRRLSLYPNKLLYLLVSVIR